MNTNIDPRFKIMYRKTILSDGTVRLAFLENYRERWHKRLTGEEQAVFERLSYEEKSFLSNASDPVSVMMSWMKDEALYAELRSEGVLPDSRV